MDGNKKKRNGAQRRTNSSGTNLDIRRMVAKRRAAGMWRAIERRSRESVWLYISLRVPSNTKYKATANVILFRIKFMNKERMVLRRKGNGAQRRTNSSGTNLDILRISVNSASRFGVIRPDLFSPFSSALFLL